MEITCHNIVSIFNKNPKQKFLNSDLVKLDWGFVCRQNRLTQKFIEAFKDYINWYVISRHQILSEKFIEKYLSKLDNYSLAKRQKLSEDFIEKFIHKLNMNDIFSYQKLSEDFINKYNTKYKITIYDLMSQKLSEKFIESNLLKSNLIYKYQKLSDKFIQSHLNQSVKNFRKIFKYQKISKMTEDLIISRLLSKDIEKINKIKQQNTMYFKKSKIRELISPYFEVKKIKNHEYIIAWKAVREDRYSLYNFQYKYEKGQNYAAHCDCNLEHENSFGLSAWTEEKAFDYGQYCQEFCQKFKIIKVKIYLKDIGAIIHDNGKIRARKITILT